MHDELKRLLKIAGAALEAEDQFLRKAVASNPVAYHNEKAGILRFNNEHYYQFVVARALVSSLRLAASIEVTSNDLVLKDPNNLNRFAVVEMKRWMSPTHERELAHIHYDVGRLRSASDAEHAFMLVFSANSDDTTETHIGWLADELKYPAIKDLEARHCFRTFDMNGDEVEFWVTGWEIDRTSIASG